MVSDVFAFEGVGTLDAKRVLVVDCWFNNLYRLILKHVVPADEELIAVEVTTAHHVRLRTIAFRGEDNHVYMILKSFLLLPIKR